MTRKYVLVFTIFIGLVDGELVSLQQKSCEKTCKNFRAKLKHHNFRQCNIIGLNANMFDPYLITLGWIDKCTKNIVNFDNTGMLLEDTITTITVMFCRDLQNANSTITSLVSSTFYKNTGRYLVVLNLSIKNKLRVKNLFRYIWKYRMTNIMFLGYLNHVLRKFEYNPFTDTMTVTSVGHYELFQEIRNMNGYKWKFLTLTKIVLKPTMDDRYYFDKRVAQFMASRYNLTLIKKQLVANSSEYSDILKELMASSADCILNTLPAAFELLPPQYYGNVEITYPHMVDNIVALVPKPSKIKSKEIIYTFASKKIVFLLAVCSGVIQYLDSKILGSKPSFLSHFWVLLKVPVSSFTRNALLSRAMWLAISFLFGLFCDTGLLQVILRNDYRPSINSLQELRSTSLPIYVNLFKPENLSYIALNYQAFLAKLSENKKDRIFIVPYSYADAFIKLWTNKNREFTYEIMPEILVPAMGSFVCKTNFPFRTMLEETSTRARQFGISDKIPLLFKSRVVEQKKMNFKNFTQAFILLVSGFLLALICFVSELCCHYFFNKKRNQSGK